MTDQQKQILDVLQLYRKDLKPRQVKRLAIKVTRHLRERWTEDYNAWYTIHRAKDMSILNENFEPIKDCKKHDNEKMRMEELYKLGGDLAVNTYYKIMAIKD